MTSTRRVITMVGAVTLRQGTNNVSGGRLSINLDTGRATIDGSGVRGSTAPGQPGQPGVQSQGGRVTGRFSVAQAHRATGPAAPKQSGRFPTARPHVFPCTGAFSHAGILPTRFGVSRRYRASDPCRMPRMNDVATCSSMPVTDPSAAARSTGLRSSRSPSPMTSAWCSPIVSVSVGRGRSGRPARPQRRGQDDLLLFGDGPGEA